ncbi:MAG: response regulator [Bacteroidales bacterium]|jgi:PAS domain S-box-containing protein
MAKIKKADNEELVIARKEHALKKEEKGKKALLKDATMNNRIKILHLEDSLKDSELIRSLIESGGIEHDYFFVDNEKDFINFLETEKVDIILCDYNLPGYKGDEALKFAKEKFSHIPFILVSGTIGQGAVSNTLINGATDYVRKSNLDRLVPVIKRALHERETEINKISAEIKLNLKNVQIEAQKEKYEQIKDELSIQKAEKEKRETENIKLEASSHSLKLAAQYARSLIEASFDPLVTISTGGKIMDMNDAFANITELTRKKLTGSDFFNYFTDQQKAREVYREIFAKGFVADYPLTICDGKNTDVLFNGSVYKDEKGNVLGAVVVARDITEQKRIEKEMTEAIVMAEMATEIAEEAKRKAEKATQIAEVAVKAKQQFLSNMSHEIRTPMNAIIGFTKVVLKTDLTAKQKEYLTAIKMSGDALIVLINDILDLAKVDAGKMAFEQTPFKMALSISAMLHLFETKIQEKNLELIKEYDNKIPDVLVGDPVRLHQIILNLVSNAVKFTTKGKITVSVHLLHEDEEKVTIEFAVSDTGIGIEESKLSSIFENFQQASSETSRLYGGTGLGLSIVKQLVEPQGGSISVKSKPGEGSTFSFILNFLKTTEDAVSEMETVEMDTEIKNIKVLVVEDMALNQLLMKTLLDDFGFERDVAANGKIAIEKLQTKSYDIILMDLQMPEMNGFEATDYIRNKLKSKIPIIALTADVTTVDLAKCKSVGMNDYIAKPIDERLLYNKIIGLVKKTTQIEIHDEKNNGNDTNKKLKCIDLTHLYNTTKSDPKLIMEMISLYLEQTPPLINAMKQGLLDKDWNSLYMAVHKMIPSFSIVGISIDFENMAKKVQEYASTQLQVDGIPDMVLQIGNICAQACIELREEFNRIKKTKNE